MFVRNHLLSLACVLFMLSTKCSGRERTDCYSNNLDPYLKFASKTAYEFVYERPKPRNHYIPNCEPVQIWLLARHGTRYPGRNTIRELHSLLDLRQQIIANHEQNGEGRLCYSDIDNLKTWTFNATMADANLLTHQGVQDMFFLARRMRTKFPNLFAQGYSQNLFQFRHTATERTRQSAQMFAEGLFGKDAGVWIPPAIINDTVIKPYENCTYWQNMVEDNDYNKREVTLFKEGQEMMNVVRNVSRRLGFLYDLSQDTVEKMYDICRYDKAWEIDLRSPWCAAFTKEELEVFEYLEDMDSYYEESYGNELNLRLGCTTIKDMIEKFTLLENDGSQRESQPNGIFYFTHSTMLSMTLARMGIAFDSVKLRHDNYKEQMKRKWRTSNIGPFASNLAAVFYKCSSGEYNQVMFYLEEGVLDYEGCEVGLCSWTYIRDRFMETVQQCNLDWCHDRSSADYVHYNFLYILCLALTSLFLVQRKIV